MVIKPFSSSKYFLWNSIRKEIFVENVRWLNCIHLMVNFILKKILVYMKAFG